MCGNLQAKCQSDRDSGDRLATPFACQMIVFYTTNPKLESHGERKKRMTMKSLVPPPVSRRQGIGTAEETGSGIECLMDLIGGLCARRLGLNH